MTGRSFAAATGLVLLVACSASPAASGPSATPEPTAVPTPSNTATPSPTASATAIATAATESEAPASGETITGVLGFEGIEGGCSYVGTEDGTRYEVVWPDGYSIEASNGDLVGPDGGVVVPLGGELEVRGAHATTLGSICQIGPIFEASEVLAR